MCQGINPRYWYNNWLWRSHQVRQEGICICHCVQYLPQNHSEEVTAYQNPQFWSGEWVRRPRSSFSSWITTPPSTFRMAAGIMTSNYLKGFTWFRLPQICWVADYTLDLWHGEQSAHVDHRHWAHLSGLFPYVVIRPRPPSLWTTHTGNSLDTPMWFQ